MVVVERDRVTPSLFGMVHIKLAERNPAEASETLRLLYAGRVARRTAAAEVGSRDFVFMPIFSRSSFVCPFCLALVPKLLATFRFSGFVGFLSA